MKKFKVYFQVGDKKLMKKVTALNEGHAKMIVLTTIQFIDIKPDTESEDRKVTDKDIEFLDKIEKVIDKMADLGNKFKK